MADFTGLTVRLTLKHPPGTVLHGRVQQVVAGQTLSLVDVQLQNGERLPHCVVQGATVADLQVVSTQRQPPPLPPPQPPTIAPQQQPQQQYPPPHAFQHGGIGPGPAQAPLQAPLERQAPPPAPPPAFVDPAILSFRPSPVQTKTTAKPPAVTPQRLPSQAQLPIPRESPKPRQPSQVPQPPQPQHQTQASQPLAPSTPVKSMLAKAAETLPQPQSGSPFIGEAKQGKHNRPQAELPDDPVPIGKPISIDTRATPGADSAQNESQGKKKVRRGQKKKQTSPDNAAPDAQVVVPPQIMNTEVSRNGNDMNGAVKRGKGWRSTPLLQPTSSPTANDSPRGKGKKRQQQQTKMSDQNGWATEDATDIQDMGEFDFEANHKLFDKKTVFDELRRDDTTADEDRLVSHNRHRPGTYGGKNLHPTENVLSPPLGPSSAKRASQADLDSSSDADTEANLNDGRSSSRHSITRSNLAKKQGPSRQNSQILSEPRPSHPLSASISSERGRGASKPTISVANRASRPLHSNVSSPRPEEVQSPRSAPSASRRRASPGHQVQGPRLVLKQSQANCPVLHPSALELLEVETVSRYALTHDAITESAARSIAETAINLVEHPAFSARRDSRANGSRAGIPGHLQMTNSRPPFGQAPQTTVVMLAGNHTIGARAIAAARHLLSRKCNIIISEARYESSDAYDAQLAAQTSVIKRMQKAGWPVKRGSWKKASQYIKQLPAPPALIIDALLSGSTYEGLVAESSNATLTDQIQSEAREMIDWANRSRAPVFSIGCPSGVSGIDGTATIVEGEPLAIRPEKLLSLGLPMQGLLEAMKAGERWDVDVADIGINVALRGDDAIAFGNDWILAADFVDDRPVDVES